RPQCLPGTRGTILDEIVEWVSSCSEQNVFWLYGVAGSGKSTVSTTIAEHFRAISRLGAHIFFQRGKSEPSSVIRTLAYKLASFDSMIANHVMEAIQQDNDIAQASGTVQFERLINDPLVHSGEAMQGPVIIVLDALDECGTEKNRRGLLELLREGLPGLPKNFRFLITSRKELDIERALKSVSECIRAVELEHNSTACKDEVLRYIDHEMRIVFAKNELRPSADWQSKMDRLGDAAGGLFIWASTAVKLVDRDYPARRLNDLVSKFQSVSALDNLYCTVLETSGISFDDEESRFHFSQVLGLVLLCKVPLSDDAIDGILGYSDEDSSRLVLSRLQSVIVYTPGAPIRFCHTSFRDYLSAPEREKDPWFINLKTQREFIASRCFTVMRDMLRFNICDIASLYIPNDKIPDLPNRIKANIPPQLEYACLFWSQHLLEAPFLHELLNELPEFLNKHLLYWLEVMSVLGKVNVASPALLHAMNWVSSHNADVLAFLRDARRTITIYLPAISRSTPHIYISFLLFASRESKFLTNYLKPDLRIVRVEQMGVKQWSPLLKELTGHKDRVTSVAFSPDGTRVTSGSYNKTIRIWDAESGRVIFGPFEGHTGWVQSVAFSPDGARVVSGSNDKTIRIWDVESGQMVSEPMEGHTDTVYSVAFSPDGMHVASGSADNTVMVWDVKSGQAAKRFEGHDDGVSSVAYSSDGKRIVSGSYDTTIRIWDVESGQTVHGPLIGHSSSVESVAFSRDGTRIASGSFDNTIRIWDAQSGECISKPFEGHTRAVTSIAFSSNSRHIASGSDDMTVRIWDVLSVAFSPDGTRVASGSWDDTIRIWDAEIRCIALSPNCKRVVSGSDDGTIRVCDAEIWSVVFSPDGRRVASCSWDPAIRVWDAESGNAVSGPFEGHTSLVFSVCFSPDGSHVASGSDDETVRIWDVESGKTTSGPFKGHKDAVLSAAFLPDGRYVVSGSRDTTTIAWDVESGEIISGPLEGHTDGVLSVAFSPDGTRVVSGSWQIILVWSVENGQVVAGPFEGHTDWVQSVAFSPDGARIVSGSADGTVRVWDACSGQAIFAPFEGHTNQVWSVAFSSDGRRVVSGSLDCMVRMWNVQ
ncbi:WD40 repeat-like protein, partial [Fomitiporia mediterranea MF3/22]|uniref:WD40 repeat-like protein n=1 Tax=Fomitiporia mediterranea (strain MF3/22) TaxID=694068 RepID=UPI0004407EED